jgi:hypothetical protein
MVEKQATMYNDLCLVTYQERHVVKSRQRRSTQGHKKKDLTPTGASKSERSGEDSETPVGLGATDIEGRMAASIGDLTAVLPSFQHVQAVPLAGVRFALPALLSNGLLDHKKSFFRLPKGDHGIDRIFLLLAFMALCRVKTIESLRYCAPGEWGKIIGLDRIPDVRTRRQKIQILVTDETKVKPWGETLCQQWMEASPALAGVLYIDGHVRVYNGY